MKIETKKITPDYISKWAKHIRTIKSKQKRYEFILNLNELKQIENYRL